MSIGILNGNTYGLYSVTTTITPASVAAASAVQQTFSVPIVGLRTTDLIIDITPPSDLAGVTAALGRVSAADTLAIKFVNPTAGAVVPPAGAYIFTVLRMESNAPDIAISD